MPAFRSLRKTASSYSRPAIHHRSASNTSETSHSLPPPYPGSDRTSISASDDDVLDFYSPAPSRPQSSGSTETNTRAVAQGGVDWKYAGQGQALLELSTREAHSAVPDAAFSRKLYLDSVQYLLNGLPSDLSIEEDLGLRAAIPTHLKESGGTAETSVVVQTALEDDAVHFDRSSTRHSTLHQAVASITVHIFLAVAFILPYIQFLLQQAYRYDREHKISDRVLAQGAVTADMIAKQLLLLANNVYEMHDGKVGMAVRDVGLWWVHGVSGGVYEGNVNGIHRLDNQLPQTMEPLSRTASVPIMENASEAHVEIEGINYYTLLERPNTGSAGEDAPCILLVHTLMSNLHMWDATVKTLTEAGYRTLRYDHVGHHNTPPAHDASRKYHLDDLTRHAHQLAKARLGTPAHLHALIGCSIGGVLALRYSMMFPDDVERIISIAAPGLTAPEETKPLWTDRIAQFETDLESGDDTLCHATVNRWFPGLSPADASTRAEALHHVKTCSVAGYRTLADAIRSYDYADDVASLSSQEQQVKCLVVAGSDDAAARPEMLREVAGKVKGADFVVMKGAGHLPPMHQPEEFGDLAVRFLRA
ncbi:hypothetical protein KC345_g3473 [Hortaea werneckii]|nr:hypothetical protein KC345_g3473 [Hortaea werneckii]